MLARCSTGVKMGYKRRLPTYSETVRLKKLLLLIVIELLPEELLSSSNYCWGNYYHHQTTTGGTATAHRHRTTAGGTIIIIELLLEELLLLIVIKLLLEELLLLIVIELLLEELLLLIVIEQLLEELLLLIIIELLLEELLSSSNYCWRTAIAQGNYYINLAPIAETMATEMKYADIPCYKANTTNKYRKGLTDNEKWNIRDKASKYIVEKNLLYIQEKDKQSDLVRKRCIIAKEEDKQRTLSMCHSGVDGMHFGRD